ncbi:putative Na+/H+ antiporter [Uliginosibacterium sediminicola]|uniref:Na+/H+ antiporter n=1 Tax=Uliginosibacterium sediminicola TaxID=2024550 RepID=A0ABU9YZW1_9RHOO
MSRTIELIAAVLFALAILHTFMTSWFERLAHAQPAHAGLWHFFGEVEAVFGIWATVLLLALAIETGSGDAPVEYLESLNFTEPMFVFVVMVVAASRPILALCRSLVNLAARCLPLAEARAFYLVVLLLVPLLGSLVTEPAAMTLAAILLRDRFFVAGVSERFKYATLAVLFVNVSIGGVLTSFAAPPVLMVASVWQWDSLFMFTQFGWKAALAVACNALAVSFLFARELGQLPPAKTDSSASPVPPVLTVVHLLFLCGVIVTAHHPVVFMALFLLFLGVADAYRQHQDRLILREGLMVALFLAGLVVLGALQKWWLQPLLSGLDTLTLFFGAMALTTITDNAALTYLGSLVEGVDAQFKYALVAGAVAAGGLTVIANAPNPAGFSILKPYFADEAINPLRLFLFALLPTLSAALAFLLL